jgi:hypothetical protein
MSLTIAIAGGTGTVGTTLAESEYIPTRVVLV